MVAAWSRWALRTVPACTPAYSVILGVPSAPCPRQCLAILLSACRTSAKVASTGLSGGVCLRARGLMREGGTKVATWRRRSVAAQGLLVACLTASACSGAQTPRLPPEYRVGWNQLESKGFGQGNAFAVTLTSAAIGENRTGYLALVSDDGAVRFVETGPTGDGNASAADGLLCVATETATYELTATGGHRMERGGYPGATQWTAATEDSSCVVLINAGMAKSGYQTDIYWGEKSEPRHQVVNEIPGPVGFYDGAVWVRNGAVSHIPGRLTLHRADLETGQPEEYMSWSTYTRKATSTSPAINFDDGYGSNLLTRATGVCQLGSMSRA